MNRRLSDRHPWLALAERLWTNLVPLLALALALYAVLQVERRSEDIGRLALANEQRIEEGKQLATKAATLAGRLEREGRRRRDQACTQDERRHLDDVKRLRRTYEFLGGLPRSEWGTTLTKAIVRGLAEVERDARVDVAPRFCDEPGVEAERRGEPPVGLPEPDPVIPEPRNFDRLLKRP
jgi:hypothetical protein